MCYVNQPNMEKSWNLVLVVLLCVEYSRIGC